MPLVDLVRRDGPAVWGADKTQAYLQLHRKLQEIHKQSLKEPGIEVMCVEERGRAPTHVAIRGTAAAQGDQVTWISRSADAARASTPLPPATSCLAGRLADEAGKPDDARVLVNRLWHYHFGRGIVGTPNDFGKLGELPTHPELLDWLADEFVQGWKSNGCRK